MISVVSQLTEYGLVVSVAIVVQVPAPCGEDWNAADATPEPLSAESEETVTMPFTVALEAGAVSAPVGFVESFVNVSVVVDDVLPALSVEVIASVGELVVPSVHA